MREKLRDFRLALKLTQQMVADELGWPQSTYAELESGKLTPSLDRAVAFLDWCDRERKMHRIRVDETPNRHDLLSPEVKSFPDADRSSTPTDSPGRSTPRRSLTRPGRVPRP